MLKDQAQPGVLKLFTACDESLGNGATAQTSPYSHPLHLEVIPTLLLRQRFRI